MNHPELDLARYPNAPGYKRGGTSKAAADSMKKKAPTLRDMVIKELSQANATADECAAAMGLSLLSVRPRFTELLALGKIADTGMTRPNASGRMATVWRAV
jgi:predicted ArsR family transcriptional regulator